MHERSESCSVIPHYPHVDQYCICFQAAHTHLIKGHFRTISLFQMVVLKLVSQRSFCFCTLFTFSHLFFVVAVDEHSFDPRFSNHDSVVAVWLLAEIWKWVFYEAVESDAIIENMVSTSVQRIYHPRWCLMNFWTMFFAVDNRFSSRLTIFGRHVPTAMCRSKLRVKPAVILCHSSCRLS